MSSDQSRQDPDSLRHQLFPCTNNLMKGINMGILLFENVLPHVVEYQTFQRQELKEVEGSLDQLSGIILKVLMRKTVNVFIIYNIL